MLILVAVIVLIILVCVIYARQQKKFATVGGFEPDDWGVTANPSFMATDGGPTGSIADFNDADTFGIAMVEDVVRPSATDRPTPPTTPHPATGTDDASSVVSRSRHENHVQYMGKVREWSK